MTEFHVKRCFVGIPLDAASSADVAEMTDRVDVQGMRRTPRENYHVTVKFLGDVDDPEIPQVIEALRLGCEGIEPFDLELTRLAYLPDVRRIRVLAAVSASDISPSRQRVKPVMRLYEQIEDAMEVVGFQREGRRYRPHVTVGRFKRRPRGAPDLDVMDWTPTGLTVDRVVLYQSLLERDGVHYAQLAEVMLGGGVDA